MFLMRALMVVALVGLAAGCAGDAGPGSEGRYSLTVVTQHEHAFTAGQVSVGALVVAGGTVSLEAGSTHRGTILALAGDLTVGGTVDGDLLALGGTVTLRKGAVVTGDAVVAGADLRREPGSLVQGQVTEQADVGEVAEQSGGSESLLDRLPWMVATVVGMAGFAWLMVRLAPRATERVRRAATTYPVVSGALGTLVLVTAPAFLVAMVFTLVLFPLALVLVAPLAGVVVYGLVALGLALGGQITRRTRWQPSASARAAWGTGALAVVINIAGRLPLLGVLPVAVLGAVGTGAVLLTGLGTRTYAPPTDPLDEEAA